ncbi:L-shaped tail fiber protein [Escherichia phage FL12]
MATLKQIQFKRSKTAGARPAASVLAEGELAINLKDRTIFTKDDSGNIIDLGIAKGGQVDGDVTINGKLTLNGAYVQTLAGINTTGGINSGAAISATTYYARSGSFYARAPDANANTHIWFENNNGIERGVIWAVPNTSDLGQVKIRAKTTGGVFAGEYSFRSDGQFEVPVAVKIGGAAMLTKDGNITSGSLFGGNLNNYLNTIKNDIVTGDNKKVSKTGDTMSGNLTINANLKVENSNGTFVDLGSENSDKNSRLTLARKIGDGAGVAMLKVTPEGNVQFGYQPTVATPSPTKYILIKSNGLEVEGDLVFKQTYRGVEEAVDITNQTIDLNSLIIRGSDLGTRKLYKCRSSGGGSNILNKPTSDGNFTLEVLSLRKVSDTDWSCKQTFTTKNNNVVGVYVRYGQVGSWTEWKEVVAGVQPINLGGTGATSVAAARNNLGVGEGQTVTFGNLVTNNLNANGQVKIGRTGDALRIWNAEYGAIFRRSETALHIIPTPKDAGESGGISNLRPLSIGLNNGMVQMRHSVELGDDGAGGNMITVDNDSKNVVITSNARLSPNFRMQLGQASYIDAECTTSVRPAGAGSFASQNNENVRAPLYMNIDRTDNSTYVPILKQRYVQGNSCYSLGTLINNGDFRLHYHEGGDGSSTGAVIKDISWEFKRNGDFYSPGRLRTANVYIGTDGNITGGSGNFANLNTTLNRKVNVGGWAGSSYGGWYKFATVTIPQGTGTVTFKISGGAGFNFKRYSQASIAEIVLRTGNNNPKGINAVLWNRSDLSFNQIATMNTSGDTYDVYVFCDGYTNALVVEYSCSENSSVTVVGLNGGIQPAVDALPEGHVVGKTVRLLNNIGGTFAAGESDIVTRGEYVTDNQKGMRIKSNGNNIGSNAAILRNDGRSFYILATDKNTAEKSDAANGDWNSLRPFTISMTTGEVSMNNGITVRNYATFYNDIVLKDNGYIHFNKSGNNPRNMSIFHAGDATRGNRIEIADDSSYLVYFQRLPGGANQCTFNSAALSGITQTNSFGVNTSNALGGNSITFGDNDTGIKQNGDGLLDIYTNSVQVFRFQNGDLYSYKNINAPNVYIRSDIRLKSNFKPIENALDKVEKLNGVIYDKAEYIGGEAIETEAGIVAQTLQDVLPEAVRETEDSKGNKILTVSSQAQIALLVEAVKTLSSRVKELESKLM